MFSEHIFVTTEGKWRYILFSEVDLDIHEKKKKEKKYQASSRAKKI